MMDLTDSEKIHLGHTEIVKRIKKQLTDEFPNSKFSVSQSRGSAIDIALMESNLKIVKSPNDISANVLEKYKRRNYTKEQIVNSQNEGYHQLNQYTTLENYNPDEWNNGVFLTKEGHNLMKRATEIVEQYNFDHSDSNRDFSNVNFFLHLSLGKHNKPFIQNTENQKTNNGVNMTSKKFKKLEEHIAREYEQEGFSKKRAQYIGKATAGKVAREKKKIKV